MAPFEQPDYRNLSSHYIIICNFKSYSLVLEHELHFMCCELLLIDVNSALHKAGRYSLWKPISSNVSYYIFTTSHIVVFVDNGISRSSLTRPRKATELILREYLFYGFSPCGLIGLFFNFRTNMNVYCARLPRVQHLEFSRWDFRIWKFPYIIRLYHGWLNNDF